MKKFPEDMRRALFRRDWLKVATGGLALAVLAAIWVNWRFG